MGAQVNWMVQYVCLCVCKDKSNIDKITCVKWQQYDLRTLENISYAKMEWRGNGFIHNPRSRVKQPGPE